MKKNNSFEMLTLSLLFYAARIGMSAYCRLSHMHTLSTNGWYSVTWKILVPSKPHVVAKKRLLLALENLLEQQQFRSEESVTKHYNRGGLALSRKDVDNYRTMLEAEGCTE